MKQKVLNLKTALIVLAVLCSSGTAIADDFIAVLSGNFSNGSTWQGGVAPSGTITQDDNITIPSGIVVTLDQDLTIDNNGASVSIMGTLSGVNNIDLLDGGISGGGTMDVKDFHLRDGATFNFTGDAVVDNFYNYGNITTFADITAKSSIRLMGGNLSLLADLSLEDGGKLNFNGGNYINLTGQLNFNGSYSLTYLGTSSNIGNEAIGNGVHNITINLDNDDDDIELGNDLIVNGTLDIQQGRFHTNQNDIIINGNILSTQAGSIVGDNQSNLIINGNTSTDNTLYFLDSDNWLNNLDINKGADEQNVILMSDLRLNGDLNMKNGNLSLNGNTLLVTGVLTAGGSGHLVGGNGSNLTLNHNGNIGDLRFTDDGNSLDNLTINGGVNTMLSLASDVKIMQNLNLNNGKIDIKQYDLELEENATISGDNQNNYIITSSEGGLILNVDTKSEGIFFPIGNDENYSPVRIYNNTDKTDYKVRAYNGVYADGTSGNDISSSGKMVKGSWFVENTSGANIDMSLRVMWNQSMEVNDFERNNAYISHYTNSSWDVSEQTDVVTETNGMYSIKRNNITSLSPFSVREVNTSDVDKLNTESVKVYPNPAQHKINIDIKNNMVSDINIIDVLGKEVMNVSSNETIDISGLAKGVYIIRINGEQVSKFVKQ